MKHFLPGEEVVLIGGGPVLTVESVSEHTIDDEEYEVACIWFNRRGNLKARLFLSTTLIHFDEVSHGDCCEEDELDDDYPEEEIR